MARTGRPKKDINQSIFEGLCAIQCTEVEICSCFDCCEDTLNAWCKRTYKDEKGRGLTFSEAFKKCSSKGKVSLRRAQFKLAEKNAAMAIWLGKQHLGQCDTPPVSVAPEDVREDALSKSLKELATELESD